MSAGSSSFQRPQAARPGLPGVRPSPRTGRPLVSCGAPHLDTLLGGGLPLGTLLTVREDSQGSYARLLLRYFLAEGLVHGHGLLAGQAEGRDLLASLPALDTPGGEEKAGEGEEERMRIAWRYQGQASPKGEPPRAAKG